MLLYILYWFLTTGYSFLTLGFVVDHLEDWCRATDPNNGGVSLILSRHRLVVALSYKFTVPSLMDVHSDIYPIRRKVVSDAITILRSYYVMSRKI